MRPQDGKVNEIEEQVNELLRVDHGLVSPQPCPSLMDF